MYLEVSDATCSPYKFSTIINAISIPEETPAEVIISSFTTLLSVITWISLLIDLRASIAPQCVVALLPSNKTVSYTHMKLPTTPYV